MKTFWKLIRDSIYSLILHVAPRFANVVLFIILGWIAGPNDAGAFVLATTYLLIFTTIMRGLDDLVVRQVSRQSDEAKNYLITFIGFRLILSSMLYGLLVLIVQRIFTYPPITEATVLILCLSLFPDNLSYVCQSVLLGQRLFLTPTLIIGGTSIVKLIFGSMALFAGFSLITIAWVWLVCSSIGMVVILLFSFRSVQGLTLNIQKNIQWLKSQKRVLLVFLFITTLAMLESQTDTILLSGFLSEREIGLYGAATTVTFSLVMFAQAYRFAIYPQMSRYALNQPEKLEELYVQSLRYLGILVFPVVGGIWVLAPQIVPLVFGEGFLPTINYLQLLVFTLIFVFLNEPNIRLLLVNEKQNLVVVFLLISAFINVAGNLILIPQFSIYGAVTARLLSTFVLFLGAYVYVKRRYMPISWTPIFLKPIIATTVMVTGLSYFSFWQNILIDIIIGILIYFSLLFLFGEVSLQVIKDSSKEWLNKKNLFPLRKPSAKG